MTPNVGQRLGSTVCTTEVIVVRASSSDIDLTCGHAAMAVLPVESSGEVGEDGPGTLVGKRYEHPESGLELLCTKPGAGQLRVGGAVLGTKQAKNLPSSD